MKRRLSRLAVVVLAVVLALAPLVAQAQPPGKIPRIAGLNPGRADAGLTHQRGAFLQGLRERGWIDGRNAVILLRFAEGRTDRLPEMARQLVREQVDVIVATTSVAGVAARQATTAIPIIYSGADPQFVGLVGELRRPGGNVTGVSTIAPDLIGKQLQLLREAVGELGRVALLVVQADPATPAYVREAEAAARSLGATLDVVEVRGGATGLGEAFEVSRRRRAQALLAPPNNLYLVERARIAESAGRLKIPAMYSRRENVEAGGLMPYGVNLAELYRTVLADYTNKILRGAKPADLPIAQPTRLELMINLKTARALGLTIAPLLLLRADKVIE